MNIVEKTNGKKTKGAALVYLLVVLLGHKIPFVAENKENVMIVIDGLIASGLLHDVYRNRKKIITFIKSMLKKETE